MSPLLRDILFSRLHARFFIILSSLVATILGLFGPYFQKLFVDQLTGTSTPYLFSLNLTPLTLIFLAFACVLSAQGFSQLTGYLGIRESVFMQSVLSQRLYKQTLNLRVDTMSHRPVGEIIQIYAADIPGSTTFLEQTLPAGASTLFPLIFAPFAISMIYHIPLAPTLIAMGVITSLNTAMAFRQSKFFYSFKRLAGERIALVNEWIQNIRTIRILGWISHFEKGIFEKRKAETTNRISMVTNGQTMNAVASSVTFVLNIVALVSLIHYSNHRITGGDLLALLWIVGVFLTRPFRQMPWFFTFGFDAWTSVQRLEAFLNIRNENQNLTDQGSANERPSRKAPSDVALEVQNLNLKVGKKEILKNINLCVKEGEFVALVGEVGCGKTMLLLSLLNETGATMGHYFLNNKNAASMTANEVRKHFAYVPQEGFIMSASLRENVAFIYDMRPDGDDQIEESLRLAQFEISNERVENGLATEIGERGVNLSGGQKQRVSLARVHYHQAPILLLDDCLSAIDVDTEERLVTQLLDGAWQDRTRILATHRLTILNRVDRILFMQEGRIIDQGSLLELMTRSQAFRDYTASVEKKLEDEYVSANA